MVKHVVMKVSCYLPLCLSGDLYLTFFSFAVQLFLEKDMNTKHQLV